MLNKQQLYKVVKWLFALGAYGYLAYKLIVFDQYDSIFSEWKQTPPTKFTWLLATLVLLPLNLLLESLKWKKITQNSFTLTTYSALKSVLSGICSGFFTPNRIGDFVGRISYLPSSARAQGITLSIVNSLTQNLTILLCGIPACVLFFISFYHSDSNSNIFLYLILTFVFLLLLGLFYFSLPRLSKRISSEKIKRFTDCLSGYTLAQLGEIMAISIFRYCVFFAQFFLMLRFFNVELTVWQAAIAIPANYLLVTFTPSFAFSEAAVRGSYAVFFIGMFASNTVGIAFSGILIWLINTVTPMLIGSVFLLKSKSSN